MTFHHLLFFSFFFNIKKDRRRRRRNDKHIKMLSLKIWTSTRFWVGLRGDLLAFKSVEVRGALMSWKIKGAPRAANIFDGRPKEELWGAPYGRPSVTHKIKWGAPCGRPSRSALRAPPKALRPPAPRGRRGRSLRHCVGYNIPVFRNIVDSSRSYH